MEWVQRHFFDILIGAGVLLTVYWLYHHAGRLFSGKAKNKFYCKHCNWEGTVNAKNRRCKRCGSRDLGAVTH